MIRAQYILITIMIDIIIIIKQAGCSGNIEECVCWGGGWLILPGSSEKASQREGNTCLEKIRMWPCSGEGKHILLFKETCAKTLIWISMHIEITANILAWLSHEGCVYVCVSVCVSVCVARDKNGKMKRKESAWAWKGDHFSYFKIWNKPIYNRKIAIVC